jgi:para-nitrobenzyl esterase|tara:strand:+ start:948 stop:1169 length:222 start_codon:yes stop_codon:yes gene_type:complete
MYLFALPAVVVSILITNPIHAAGVSLSDGTLVGVHENDVHSFKGIRYAVPPTGSRRWRAPEAALTFNGQRLAT